MAKEAKNYVSLCGILLENGLKYSDYTSKKDGKTYEAIGGSVKLRVDLPDNTLEIPVHFFSNKYTKDGRLNPSYTSIEKAMKEFTSVAAAAESGLGPDAATRVSIGGARVSMNEYYGQNGQLVSFPRVMGSFLSKVTGEFIPEATFELEFVLSGFKMATDKDGVELEPAKLIADVIVPCYGGRVEVLKLAATKPSVISAIQANWEPEKTYAAHGDLYFTSKTETKVIDQGMGDPITKEYSTNISELIIRGGTPAAYDDEAAFDLNVINEGLKARKAALEATKNKAAAGSAPAAGKPRLSAADMGF